MFANGRCVAFLILLSILSWSSPAVDSALAQAQPPATSTFDTSHYGPLMRFARSAQRPVSPQTGAHIFTLRPLEARTADDRRIVIDGIVAHIRIDDPARFERAFRYDADKMSNATGRVQAGFEDDLRRAVGRMTLPELAAFDPFALIDEGAQLRRLLDQAGLAIDDLDGDAMGYRTRVR